MNAREEITQLLVEVSEGRDEAWEPLMATVYDELRRLARGRLRLERRGHTLGTTALVHEAYLKLVNLDRLQWHNRGQFFAIAAQAMRRILVDYARTAKRLKRGGGQTPASLEEQLDKQEAVPLPAMTETDADELLALDRALTRLGAVSERQRQVIEWRAFVIRLFEDVDPVQAQGSSVTTRSLLISGPPEFGTN